MNKPVFHNSGQPFLESPGTGEALNLTDIVGSYHRPHDPVILPADSTGQQTIRQTNLRTYRRNFTIACTAFTLGALLIIFSSDGGREIIAPGPLSSPHAPLVSLEGGDRCAVCHDANNKSFGTWIGSLFTSHPGPGKSQSELCMKCHAHSFSSTYALNAHNICPTELSKVTQRILGTARSSDEGSPETSTHSEIACSICHQEHHGGDQLKTLTDHQCQSCHNRAFESFEQGHPDFANYSQRRRSRIAFDHAAHFGQHFPEKGKAFECALCHQADAQQNVIRLAPFEQSCAQCHNDQILDSVSDGLVLLSLPMLDMQAIEKAGLEVGNWPLAATGDFDGKIPALMRSLLMADPLAKEVLMARGTTFDFLDLDAANPQDVKQAVELAWAIKRLIGDLATHGPQELKRRFDLALQTDLSHDQLSQMASTLDHTAFQTLAFAWLPDWQQELQLQRKHQPIVTANRADALFEAITMRLDSDSPQIEATYFASDATSPELVEPSHQTQPSLFQQAKASIRVESTEDELLADNPLHRLMAAPMATSDQSETVPANTDNLLDPDKPNSPDEQSQPTEAIPSVASPAPSNPLYPANAHNRILFDTLNRPSGWIRDDSNLQISYRAKGHADPCIRSWMDFVASVPQVSKQKQYEPLLKNLLDSTGIGQCRTCHTVDQDPAFSSASGSNPAYETELTKVGAASKLTINWLAQYRDPALRGFTRFSHAPHLVHADLNDCQKCHELDRSRRNAASFSSFEPGDVISNFRPIVKADCLDCHQLGRTNSSCMQCHHYHVEK
jgi:hypothetical protein